MRRSLYVRAALPLLALALPAAARAGHEVGASAGLVLPAPNPPTVYVATGDPASVSVPFASLSQWVRARATSDSDLTFNISYLMRISGGTVTVTSESASLSVTLPNTGTYWVRNASGTGSLGGSATFGPGTYGAVAYSTITVTSDSPVVTTAAAAGYNFAVVASGGGGGGN